MKKRVISLLLVIVLAFSLMPAVLATEGLQNFTKSKTYPSGKFTDVPDNEWYTASVKNAYEYDLVKGTGDSTFSPSGNVTIASAITLACRLHSIYYTGKADFIQGSPWYQVYVDYAVANGIIKAGEYTDMNAAATRVQYAAIMSKALPDTALQQKNTVDDNAIPDVKMTDAHAADIYKLYRAGILTGSDTKGTFRPDSTIMRSEVSALVTRMADASLRRSLNPMVAVTGVTLDKASLKLKVGESVTLKATVLPENATAKTVSWYSSNTEVATVDSNGKIVAIKEGSARITATANNDKSCYATVEVVDNNGYWQAYYDFLQQKKKEKMGQYADIIDFDSDGIPELVYMDRWNEYVYSWDGSQMYQLTDRLRSFSTNTYEITEGSTGKYYVRYHTNSKNPANATRSNFDLYYGKVGNKWRLVIQFAITNHYEWYISDSQHSKIISQGCTIVTYDDNEKEKSSQTVSREYWDEQSELYHKGESNYFTVYENRRLITKDSGFDYTPLLNEIGSHIK